MKKLLLIIAVALISCDKEICSTCAETIVTNHTEPIYGRVTNETEVRKYTLCEQADVDAVDGQVIIGQRVYTSNGRTFQVTKTTNCN